MNYNLVHVLQQFVTQSLAKIQSIKSAKMHMCGIFYTGMAFSKHICKKVKHLWKHYYVFTEYFHNVFFVSYVRLMDYIFALLVS